MIIIKLKITLNKNMTFNEVNSIFKSNDIKLSLMDNVYNGNQYNHKWRCECGEIFIRSWMYIKSYSSVKCKKCVYGIKDKYDDISEVYIEKGMSRDEVNKLIGEWILLDDEMFEGATHKHNWTCKCGETFIRLWDKIKIYSTIRCLQCIKRDTLNKHKELVELNDGYKYISSYLSGDILPNGKVVKSNSYIEVEHLYCKSIYLIRYSNFINHNQKCSKCCLTYENSFAHYIEVELGESLDKYWDFDKNTVNPCHISKCRNEKDKEGNDLKVWIKCQNEEINELNRLIKKEYHGSYEISCNKFVNGKRCGYCKPGGKNPKVHPYDSFGYHNFDKVQSWHPDNKVSPFRVAPSCNKKYKFICEECNTIFDMNLDNITHQNSWCPRCNSSKGEKRIEKWLLENKVEYTSQKEFEGLIGVNNGNLSYDFYLPDYNLLIEYQGRQHKKYIPGFHTNKNDFEKQQEHDRRKKRYAKDSRIKLLEIWYCDFDYIEDILDNYNLK